MPTLTIDGQQVEVEPNTTLIEAAAQLGIEVPHFCYHPALSRPANCRMCLVEVERAPKLLPACYTMAADGQVVKTGSERVVRARKAVLEFILINHPVDCPICDQAGECKLQDYYFEYSAQESRLSTRKVDKVKVFPIGPEVVYDGERCILCTRCVRFCEEITQTHELTVSQRADMAEIRTFPGRDLDNDYSLCTVDLCPVGALTSRDFRFKCRVWYLETTPSVCTGCAMGCNIQLEHFKGEVQRYRPRPNPEVNAWWMCDHGRRTYKAIHTNRLLNPTLRGGEEVGQQRAIAEGRRLLLGHTTDERRGALGVVLSPQMSNEDLLGVLHFAQEGFGVERFYISGKPDDAFTLRDQPGVVSDDFLIKADKNPNRAGLERLARARGVALGTMDALLGDVEAGALVGLVVCEADVPIDEAAQARLLRGLRSLEVLVYLGQHVCAFSAEAHLALPTCSHAEQNGSFVNVQGRRQAFAQAFAPQGLSMSARDWCGRLAKRLRVSWPYGDVEALVQATDAALTDGGASHSQQSPAVPPGDAGAPGPVSA